jgi:hypothetical protein
MSAAVAISSITIGDRHRRDMGDLRALANSIAEVGLLQPIGMSPSGELVFGARRLRACRDILGWTEIPSVRWKSDPSCKAKSTRTRSARKRTSRDRANRRRRDRKATGPTQRPSTRFC